MPQYLPSSLRYQLSSILQFQTLILYFIYIRTPLSLLRSLPRAYHRSFRLIIYFCLLFSVTSHRYRKLPTMAEKRKPEDNHEDDSNRPNKAQKPDEAEGNKSPAEEEPKSLAELEKEAKIAREKMTWANKRLSKTRRDQNKMLREEGLLEKRSRRRKTAPEPDYAELVKAKHEQKLKQNKSKRKGTRAAESCCRCQVRLYFQP